MTRPTYQYDTTYSEGPPDGPEPYHDTETEVRIIYECTFGTPPIIHLAPEHCDPGSGDELEITNIHVRVRTIGNTLRWFDAHQDDFEKIKAWAEETLSDDLIFYARECEADAEERAREHAAETRAELARMER